MFLALCWLRLVLLWLVITINAVFTMFIQHGKATRRISIIIGRKHFGRNDHEILRMQGPNTNYMKHLFLAVIIVIILSFIKIMTKPNQFLKTHPMSVHTNDELNGVIGFPDNDRKQPFLIN